MNYYAIAVLAGLTLASSSYAQQTIPVPPVPAPTTPVDSPAIYLAGKWTYPSSGDMSLAYPAAAWNGGIRGQVTIDCEVAPTGKITSCDIISEDPAGYGFGEATANAFVEFAHVDPASVPGGIQPGARKKFIYKWTL